MNLAVIRLAISSVFSMRWHLSKRHCRRWSADWKPTAAVGRSKGRSAASVPAGDGIKRKSARLAELNALLDMDEKGDDAALGMDEEVTDSELPAPKREIERSADSVKRPSILAQQLMMAIRWKLIACADGTPNACSILLCGGVPCSTAMGYNRAVTHILIRRMAVP